MRFASWQLKVVCSVLALCLAFALIAAVAWLRFGREAEHQVVDFAVGFTEIVGMFLFRYLWLV